MDQRRVHTSRLLPLSSVEKPCVRAGGCRGGFVRGDLFRVVRYASTRAREVASNIERKCAIAFEDARNPFQTFYFGFEEIAEKFCQGVGGPKRTERRGSTGRTTGGGGLNGPNQRLSRGPSTSQMPRGYTHMHTRKGPHRCTSDTASVPPKRGLAVSPGSGVGHGEGILRERESYLSLSILTPNMNH